MRALFTATNLVFYLKCSELQLEKLQEGSGLIKFIFIKKLAVYRGKAREYGKTTQRCGFTWDMDS